VIRPHEFQLNLERRDSYLVCPHCQGYSTLDPGKRVRRSAIMSSGPIGFIIKYARNSCTVVPARNWRVAMVSRPARC
jgi:hypothetical protein